MGYVNYYISSNFASQSLKSGNSNLAIVGICAPQDSTSTKYKGFLPKLRRVHLTAHNWIQQKNSGVISLLFWFKGFRRICPFKSLLKWGFERGYGHIWKVKSFLVGTPNVFSAFWYGESFESTYLPFHNVQHSISKANRVRTTFYSSLRFLISK